MKCALIAFCAGWCLTVSVAQTANRAIVSAKPDLSGTWAFDLSKSDIGSRKGSPLYDELTLTILHREPELQVVRLLKRKEHETTQRLVYYTDKRGESNPTIDGGNKVKSKTHWEGNVLVSIGTVYQDIPFGYAARETTETWELAPDGNTLKQISSVKVTFIINETINQASPLKIVKVFQKRP